MLKFIRNLLFGSVIAVKVQPTAIEQLQRELNTLRSNAGHYWSTQDTRRETVLLALIEKEKGR